MRSLLLSLMLLLLYISAHAQPVPEGNKYYLAIANITLGSGNDNKDKGAKIYVRLRPNITSFSLNNGYYLEGYTDELKKWQWWGNDLPRASKYDERTNLLGVYQKNGILLDIWYDSYGGPFPLTDAWKLDKVKLDLVFAGYGGDTKNIHIEFPSSSLLFTKKTCLLSLTTDGNFKPLARIVKSDCNQ